MIILRSAPVLDKRKLRIYTGSAAAMSREKIVD